MSGAAIEILALDPAEVGRMGRGVHENQYLIDSREHYASVGVYQEDAEFKYFAYADRKSGGNIVYYDSEQALREAVDGTELAEAIDAKKHYDLVGLQVVSKKTKYYLYQDLEQAEKKVCFDSMESLLEQHPGFRGKDREYIEENIGQRIYHGTLQFYVKEELAKEIAKVPRYDSIQEIKSEELHRALQNSPDIFLMGHGHGARLGFGNQTAAESILEEDNYRRLMDSVTQTVLPISQGFKQLYRGYKGLVVEYEACNTHDMRQAEAEYQELTSLQRSAQLYPGVVFVGATPWNPDDTHTGACSSGNEGKVNAPVISMVGGTWKYAKVVTFSYMDVPCTIREPTFSTTESAVELKANLMDCAAAVIMSAGDGLSETDKKLFLTTIALDLDIARIEDLSSKVPYKLRGKEELIVKFQEVFSPDRLSTPDLITWTTKENDILKAEKEAYISDVKQRLLEQPPSDIGALTIALGLKDQTIFAENEDVLTSVKQNKELLSLVMVACGKTMIAGTNNIELIDLLVNKLGVDINSRDSNGMTALHYAVQNFFNYGNEQIPMLHKLVELGANPNIQDNKGRAVKDVANEHLQDGRVFHIDRLLGFVLREMNFSEFVELFDGKIASNSFEEALSCVEEYIKLNKTFERKERFFLHWNAFHLTRMLGQPERTERHILILKDLLPKPEECTSMTFREFFETPGYGIKGVMDVTQKPEYLLKILEIFIDSRRDNVVKESDEAMFLLHALALQQCKILKYEEGIERHIECCKKFKPSDDEYRRMSFRKFEQSPGYGLRGFIDVFGGSPAGLEESLRIQNLYIEHQ